MKFEFKNMNVSSVVAYNHFEHSMVCNLMIRFWSRFLFKTVKQDSFKAGLMP
jgi:hypothetical protein